MRRRTGRTVLAAVALTASLATAPPAHAEFLEDAGWGVLTVFTNLVYMPAKLTYAALGGLTGGLALGLTGGSMETAETIWVTSMGGTYAVTPGMLRGEDAIVFAGTPAHEATAESGDGAGSVGNLQEQQIGNGGNSGG